MADDDFDLTIRGGTVVINLAAQGWKGTGLRALAPGETVRMRMQLRIETTA